MIVYRIFIDDRIKDIARRYRLGLFATKRSNFVQPCSNLENLRDNLDCTNHFAFVYRARKYIDKIIADFWKNLDALPSTFSSIIKDYEKILPERWLFTAVSYNGVTKKFYKHIVDAMRYEDVGPEIYPFLEEVDLHVCVYCNVQPVVYEGKKANCTLDHFCCKSHYPYLCLSFFNLFPCCQRCNGKKSYDDFLGYFELYVEDSSERNPFLFEFGSLKNFVQTRNCDKAVVTFKLRGSYAPKMITKLDVGGLYKDKTAKDRLEMILKRAQEISSCHVNVTNDSFGLSVSATSLSSIQLECIIGKYYRIEDIHKEMCTKLSIDFAKKLGLL